MGTSRAARLIAGHTLLELGIAMVLLAAGVVALGSMEAAGARVEAARERRATAVAIARDNTRVVEGLPYARLVSAPDFEAPPWLAEPGAPSAEWTVRKSENEALGELAVERYAVSWRVEHVGGSPLLRRAHVRVQWQSPGGSPREYTLSTVRAR